MFTFIDRALSNWFRRLGRYIARNPGYFVIIPFLVSIIFVSGVQRLKYIDDPEYLFSPTNGRAKDERKIIDTLFPMNYSYNFNLGRLTHKGRFGRIVLIAKDGGSVLRSVIFDEIIKLHKSIVNISINYDDETYKYADLCAISNGKCHHNDILDFYPRIAEIESQKFFLNYPIWVNYDVYKPYFFPAYLGGVTTDSNNLVVSVKAINLMYFLDVTKKRGDEKGALWEDAFLHFLEQSEFEHISVSRFVSTTLRNELERNTHSLIPFFSITTAIMLIFSIGTCMMSDWVRSKPCLGLLACVSAGLGVAASFGLCFYIGIEMISINLAAPFLMLGVGMDDAFVLLAAWRRTNPRISVVERLGQTYSEAAVSITITSITNFISFMIGTVTPFPSVRIFCIYTASAVFFTYVYHITFFGGCMAFFGKAEELNLHSVVCVPVVPKSLAANRGFFYRFFCTGGTNDNDPKNKIDNTDHAMMIFFRDTVANALNQGWIKAVVIFCFLIYLGLGIYGCTKVKEGLDRKKLSRDDSYSIKYFDYEDRFFREYPYRVQVVINKTLNYADSKVQNQIETLLSKYESSKYIANSTLTESWLRSYLNFLNQKDSFIFTQTLNLTDEKDFYLGFREIFLNFPMTEAFRHDVNFNEDGSEVTSCRFIIQTHRILDANEEKEMLIELRNITDDLDMNVTIFHQLFIFFDQFILVRQISLQTISIAAAVMMFISLLFIPSASCAIWVAFSIVSIEIGVIGYMTHWGVNLDSISMINLIMCIGFSVDFSAHISYAYISCEEANPAARVRSALYSLGLPIFQGSISTILGIVALAFAPSYIFLTFFKTVFLVMLFGALHGILLLPVLLSVTDSCNGEAKKPGKDISSTFIENVTKQPNFFTLSKKSIDGKSLNHKIDQIFIPRPSMYELSKNNVAKFGNVVDEDSGQGSKSSASSESGGTREQDYGLGTSGEEYSDESWIMRKKNDTVVNKESQLPINTMNKSNSALIANHRQSYLSWHPANIRSFEEHLNLGYVNDNGKPYYEIMSQNEKINSSNKLKTASHATSPSLSNGNKNRLFAYYQQVDKDRESIPNWNESSFNLIPHSKQAKSWNQNSRTHRHTNQSIHPHQDTSPSSDNLEKSHTKKRHCNKSRLSLESKKQDN